MAQVELKRLLERRRINVEDWLRERNITTQDELLRACASEDVYLTGDIMMEIGRIMTKEPDTSPIILAPPEEETGKPTEPVSPEEETTEQPAEDTEDSTLPRPSSRKRKPD